MEKEETKKKKGKGKKVAIIISIVVVILIIAVIAGYFVYDYIEGSKTLGTEAKWGDKYYLYLKEAKQVEPQERQTQYGIPEQMDDATIQFCEITQDEQPEMIMNYHKDKVEYVTIYYINNENNVSYITYDKPASIELLYNIEQQRDIWYLHNIEDTIHSYKSVENILYAVNNDEQQTENANDIKQTQATPEYTFSQEEVVSTDEKISKLDETFITPEIDKDNKIEFDIDADSKEFKEAIKKSVETYQENKETIESEIEQSVEEKTQQLETKKENIRKAEEEKKKAEEEAARKAEEERKKAEEAQGLKVGNCTLKYGTYVSDISTMDSKLSGTIILQPNGKFTIKSNYNEASGMGSGLDCSGTYKIELNQPTGYPDDYSNYITFIPSKGEKFSFEVVKNNSFSDQYHGYNYKGN